MRNKIKIIRKQIYSITQLGLANNNNNNIV